jgi:hypothetical protein
MKALSYLTLAVLLILLATAWEFARSAFGLGVSGLFHAVLLGVVIPVCVIAANRVHPLSYTGVAATAAVVFAGAWLYVFTVLRAIALPVHPETTLWSVAAYNGFWAVVLPMLAFVGGALAWQWVVSRGAFGKKHHA